MPDLLRFSAEDPALVEWRIFTNHGRRYRGNVVAAGRAEACAAGRQLFGIPAGWDALAVTGDEHPEDGPADRGGGLDEHRGIRWR